MKPIGLDVLVMVLAGASLLIIVVGLFLIGLRIG